jgi:superfamily II DNA or RNA helicase
MEDNAEKMTTIVIVPTVELAADIVRTCTNKNVDCIRYDRACTFMHAPTVVVVIADTATTEDFILYARRLIDRKRLAQVVFDECQRLRRTLTS